MPIFEPVLRPIFGQPPCRLACKRPDGPNVAPLHLLGPIHSRRPLAGPWACQGRLLVPDTVCLVRLETTHSDSSRPTPAEKGPNGSS